MHNRFFHFFALCAVLIVPFVLLFCVLVSDTFVRNSLFYKIAVLKKMRYSQAKLLRWNHFIAKLQTGSQLYGRKWLHHRQFFINLQNLPEHPFHRTHPGDSFFIYLKKYNELHEHHVEVHLTCQEQRPARFINNRVRGIKFWKMEILIMQYRTWPKWLLLIWKSVWQWSMKNISVPFS